MEELNINLLREDDYIISDINPICNGCNPCYHNITVINIKNNNKYLYYVSGLFIAEIFSLKNKIIPQHFIPYVNSKN
jgi:hypothetical protein